MHRIAAALALVSLQPAGCVAHGVFACIEDDSCSSGTCQPSGYCSFAASDCTSGQRYGAHAPEELAGRCVDPSQEPDQEGSTSSLTSPSDSGPAASGLDGGESDLDSSGGAGAETSSGVDTLDPVATSSDSGSETGVADGCLVEQFDDPVLDGWSAWGSRELQPAIDDGELRFVLVFDQQAAGLTAEGAVMPGGEARLQWAQMPTPAEGIQVSFGLQAPDGSARVSLRLEDGWLQLYRHVDGGESTATVLGAWDPTQTQWSVATDETEIAFAVGAPDTAADAVAVVPLEELPFDVESARPFLLAGSWNTPQVDPGVASVAWIERCPG